MLRAKGRLGLLPLIATGGFVLALAYWALDLQGASAYQQAATNAANWVQNQGTGKGWYVGHWGFQVLCRSLRPDAVGP